MTGKTRMWKKIYWSNVIFAAMFLGIVSLFVMPAEAQSQVQIGIPGQNEIKNVLPNIETASQESTLSQSEVGLDLADTAVRNILRFVIRALQFAAVIYAIYIGAEIITHVGNEDLLEKRRPALAYAVIGFVVLSLGDNALELFNPANYSSATLGSNATLADWLGSNQTWVFIDNVLNVIRYTMWIVAVTLVVITGYRMIISQDKDITKPRQQLVWIGVGLFVIQIAGFIVEPFKPANIDKVSMGNELIANITNVLLTFFAPAAFFMLLYGAFVLVTANGDEAKLKTARNILFGTVIAVVITFSSYTIIAEVIKAFIPTV